MEFMDVPAGDEIGQLPEGRSTFSPLQEAASVVYMNAPILYAQSERAMSDMGNTQNRFRLLGCR
jgi:hypothetical protein